MFIMYHCFVLWHYRNIHEFFASTVPSHSFLSNHLVFQLSMASIYKLFLLTLSQTPIPVAARSAACRLLRLSVRPPTGAWLSLMNAVQVQVSAMDGSLIQGSPTDVCVCHKWQDFYRQTM
jgi:hypothetical protein